MFRFLVILLFGNILIRAERLIGRFFTYWLVLMMLYVTTGIYLCNPLVVLMISMISAMVSPNKKARYL